MRLEDMNDRSMDAYRIARAAERAAGLIAKKGDDRAVRDKAIALLCRAASRADMLAEKLDMPGVGATGSNVISFYQDRLRRRAG
jgi:hypothetical protein